MKELSENSSNVYVKTLGIGQAVQLTIDAFNQHGDLVLASTTEAIVKCRPTN